MFTIVTPRTLVSKKNYKRHRNTFTTCLFIWALSPYHYFCRFSAGLCTYPSPVGLCQLHPQLSLVLDETNCQSSLNSSRRWSSATSTITPFPSLLVCRCCNHKKCLFKTEKEKLTCVGASWFRYGADDDVVWKGWGGMQLLVRQETKAKKARWCTSVHVY